MRHDRPIRDRLAAEKVTAFALAVLLWPLVATALDPGDGSTMSAQQVRRPLELDVGKPTRVETSLEKPGRSGEKAELSVYQVYAMHFGTLCDNDGSVTLGVADAIIADPEHLVYGGTPQSGVIRCYGDPFYGVSISISGSAGGGFVLSHFNTDQGAPPLSGLTLDATGYLTISVGARLQLDGSQIGSGTAQTVGYTVTAVYE